MTGDQWGIISTALGVVVAVAGLLWTVRRAAAEDSRVRAADERKRQLEQHTAVGEAYSNGARSRDNEIALLRSQRDDARKERDAARAEAERWENRYLDLRDRRSD